MLQNGEDMIEVTNLTKKYGDYIAVDDLSFRVEKGQIYGFLGPNGAGKSTTMNIITGYLAATAGTVTVNGKDITKEPEEAKKNIGYLPELPPLYMEMTVKEYLKFVAELKKVPAKEREQQIEEIMEATQITDMQKRLIRNLSKGYRQRVGLAQAMIGYPEVIILDEPTVGLDPKQIIEIRDLIKHLGENHTIILSSHILSEVSAVCDHIMIIAHGKLLASDSPEGLQSMIQNMNQLTLTIKGSYEAAEQILSHMDKVHTFEKIENEDQEETTIQITMEEQGDIREELFYALAEAKLPIMSLQSMKKSLEDIYLELTGEEQDIVLESEESMESQESMESEEEQPESPDFNPKSAEEQSTVEEEVD